MANVTASPSGSVAPNTIATGLDSEVWADCPAATGGRLAPTDSVDAAQRGSGAPLVAPSSQTVYPMTAVPANPTSGTKVTFPPANATVPWVSGPGVTAVTVRPCVRSSNGPASSLATNVAAGTTTSAPARAVTESGCA